MNLLSFENAKTPKGERKGYLTGIMYLAPNTQSGVLNVCPMARAANCHLACLYSAGRGKFDTVKQARIRRTVYLFEQPEKFMQDLVVDIHRLKKKALKNGVIPLVRLNGTSDILWEMKEVFVSVELERKTGIPSKRYRNLMEVFPDIQFYDYTKIATRKKIPKNYDLTFSYSGVENFENEVKKANKNKMRMAVVFRHKEEIPQFFLGKEVVDGDETDLRHLDPKGVIISLYAKGEAKKDTSGFVVGK